MRALAAFTVFTFHFNHVKNGHLTGPEAFPLSFFAEGHIGVAMFMALSGYLFAKLLDGHQISYVPFLWNRLIRLFPLLILVFILYGLTSLDSESVSDYLKRLVRGFIYPIWPNGGWSIAVELHFYILLPILLAVSSRRLVYLVFAIVFSLLLRAGIWLNDGTVHALAYFTVVGGIDQFVLGILAFKKRDWVTGKHIFAVFVAIGIAIYITYFDHLGGFMTNPEFPSPSPIWIIHPFILAMGFSFLIAWYDCSFSMKNAGVSRIVAAIGACSYSIYLLHFFVVFELASWIDANVLELSNIFLILLFSFLSFLCFVPIAYLSYRMIETPPLRYRLPYKIKN